MHVQSTYLKNPRNLDIHWDPIQNSVSARSALLEAADIMYLENKHKVINCIFVCGNIYSASNTPALAKKKKKCDKVVRTLPTGRAKSLSITKSPNPKWGTFCLMKEKSL